MGKSFGGVGRSIQESNLTSDRLSMLTDYLKLLCN